MTALVIQRTGRMFTICPCDCDKSNSPYVLFSSLCVSFESFSTISRPQQHSNAVWELIEGKSIICTAYAIPWLLKEAHLKQESGITMHLFMEELNPGLYYCNEKQSCQLGFERMHLYYFCAWQLWFVNRWPMII